MTYMIVSTSWSLRSWSVGHTVSWPSVKTEQLGTHSVILEAGRGASVLPTLSVQTEQLAGQHPGQGLLLVGGVVHAGGRLAVEEVMELEDGADGPLEALAGVSEVAHDVSVLPATLDRPGSAQVGGGRGAVMDSAQEVTKLVGSHYDAREASSVLDDGNTVDLTTQHRVSMMTWQWWMLLPSPDACLQHKLLPRTRSQQFLGCSRHSESCVWNGHFIFSEESNCVTAAGSEQHHNHIQIHYGSHFQFCMPLL